MKKILIFFISFIICISCRKPEQTKIVVPPVVPLVVTPIVPPIVELKTPNINVNLTKDTTIVYGENVSISIKATDCTSLTVQGKSAGFIVNLNLKTLIRDTIFTMVAVNTNGTSSKSITVNRKISVLDWRSSMLGLLTYKYPTWLQTKVRFIDRNGVAISDDMPAPLPTFAVRYNIDFSTESFIGGSHFGYYQYTLDKDTIKIYSSREIVRDINDSSLIVDEPSGTDLNSGFMRQTFKKIVDKAKI